MIRLRLAEPQDDRTFFILRKEIQPDLTWEEHAKWWNGAWEHRYLAYDGPAFVGVIRITPILDGPDSPSDGGVLHLHVTKKEQRKGLGTQMLSRVQRIARDLGFTSLHANVSLGNIPSQKAFEGAGFEPTQFEVRL